LLLVPDGELPVPLPQARPVGVGLPAGDDEVDLVALAAVVGLDAHRDDVLQVPLGTEREVVVRLLVAAAVVDLGDALESGDPVALDAAAAVLGGSGSGLGRLGGLARGGGLGAVVSHGRGSYLFLRAARAQINK